MLVEENQKFVDELWICGIFVGEYVIDLICLVEEVS